MAAVDAMPMIVLRMLGEEATVEAMNGRLQAIVPCLQSGSAEARMVVMGTTGYDRI